MKETADYRIITASVGFSINKAVTQLTLDVNEAAARGWKPNGGIAVYSTCLMQVMVRTR